MEENEPEIVRCAKCLECRTCYHKYYSAVSWLYGFKYRSADKSLARPWKERSYKDQDLQYYSKTCGVKTEGISP